MNTNRSIVMKIYRKPIGPILLCLSLLTGPCFSETDGTANLTGTGVTPFDAWAAGLPAGQDGPDDTPQGDGVSNLLKFASNLDATVPDVRRLTVGAGDTAGLPGGATVGGVLRLEYLRRKASTNPGITYRPQFSGDLGTWHDFSAAETVSSIDATWERVVIDDVPPPGATERYGRLEIQLNP
jgi:hypothetical protein